MTSCSYLNSLRAAFVLLAVSLIAVDATCPNLLGQQANASQYSIVQISPPLGSYVLGNVMGLNDLGQVAGDAYPVFGRNYVQAFVGMPATTTFVPLPPSNSAYTSTIGWGVNNSGTVLTTATFENSQFQGVGEQVFVGTPSSITAIPLPLGFTQSFGSAINASGQVTGWVGGTTLQAFIGTTQGSTLIPFPADTSYSIGYSINASGQVAGIATGPTTYNRWFVFIGTSSGSTIVPLPAGWFSSGGEVYLNDAGQMTTSVSNGSQNAGYFGTATSGQLIPLPNGARSAYPSGITNTGVVVGNSDVGPWIWNTANGVQLLNALVPQGWTISTAIAINNPGEIVADASYEGGSSQAVLLTPSPLTLLDPVPRSAVPLAPCPSLLPALAANPPNYATLASQGCTVQGVAADGVSEVVVRISGQTVGTTFNLTLLNDLGSQSSSANDDGYLTAVGSTVASSTLTATAVSTPSGPIAFAIYHAPVDFVRSSNPNDSVIDSAAPQRAVTLQVQNAGSASIKILRPPVALIHGIWSNAHTWDYFSPLVTGSSIGSPISGYDSRFNVYRIDYGPYSSNSVSSIVSMNGGVFDQLAQYLTSFRTANNVAAVQFDIVAHSMGGLVSRQLVLDPRFLASDNFNKGNIHKLIAIGTPHSGTPLANSLLATSPTCHLALGWLGRTIGGAVQDLSQYSPLLTTLATSNKLPIQAHAIVGVADSGQEQASITGLENISWTASLQQSADVCNGLLPIGGYEQLFGGSSDLLVPQASQSFGFSANAVDSYNSTIHTVAPVLYPEGPDELNRILSGVLPAPALNPGTPEIPNRVIELLNTPVTQNSFSPIKP